MNAIGAGRRRRGTIRPVSRSETSTPGVYWPKDRFVRSDDGARIAYTFLGPEDGRVVALCSGFLCPDTWWYHLAPALAEAGYRVLLFHYRGIAQSTLPPSDGPDAFTVDRFAADLRAVVDEEDLRDIVIVVHSMGVQVMLEAYRLLRRRTAAVVALTGPYASPLHTLYGRRELAYLYEAVRFVLHLAYPPLLRLGWRVGWTRLPFLKLGRAVRAFGPRTSDEVVASYVAHAAAMDPQLVLRIAQGMHKHTAMDLLPEVHVPALVVVGGKDPFSPADLGHEMVAQMPDATLRTVPEGTHGTVLEYPEMVNAFVLEFLADVHARVA